jgi:histidine triad (HIT) family protein
MARSSLVKNKVLSLLVTVSRQRTVKPLVSLCYRHMIPFLPIDRLSENSHWLAFHHPQPDYPLHILILPKQEIPSLPNAPKDEPGLYADLFTLVQQLISDFKLEDSAYRLVTNGGENQAIPIWHWHLVCEASCKGGDHPGVSHD